MNRYFFFTLIIFLMFTGVIQINAQIPRTLSYQGVLTDTTGNPKPDGSYNLVFRMYDVASGGTALWSESETVATKRGLFSSILGDGTAFPSSMKFDEQYWLSIQVDAPPELSPRIPLTAVGYSMHSISADTAYVTVTSVGDTLWKRSGSNIYRLTGNVGIGTNLPSYKLDVNGSINIVNNIPGNYALRTAGNWLIGQSASDNSIAIGSSTVSNDILFYSNLGNLMTLKSNGNFGIGTNNPQATLHVMGVGNNGSALFTRAGHSLTLNPNWSSQGNYAIIATTTDIDLRFGAGDDQQLGQQMTLSQSGNVGIGLTNPGYKLDVNGDLNLSAGSVYRIGGVAQTGSSKWTQGSGDNIYRLNGYVGIGTTTPMSSLHIAGTGWEGMKIQTLTNVGARGSYINFGDLDDDNIGAILYDHETDQMELRTNDISQVAINSIGNVGIGTTAPGYKLDVNGTAQATAFNEDGILLEDKYAARFHIHSISNVENLQTELDNLQLQITNTASKWIQSGGDNIYRLNGNVGIGTTSPLSRLHITGGIRVAQNTLGSCLIMADQSDVIRWQQYIDPGDQSFKLWAGGDTGVDRVIITQDGKVGIGSTIPTRTLEVKVGGTTLADAWSIRSSRRWKTNIEPLQGSLEKVEQLQGVSFNWKESGKSDIGLIAEEVGAIVPEVVSYEENGIDAKSVDYAKLVALLIEAMKDQQKQIDELKAELNSLNPKPTE